MKKYFNKNYWHSVRVNNQLQFGLFKGIGLGYSGDEIEIKYDVFGLPYLDVDMTYKV